MTDLSLVDVFFIVTGSAVIIITVLLAIGLLYIIIFVRTIKEVAKTAQRATELVSDDIGHLRDNIRERGFSLGAIASFIAGLRRKKVSRNKK